MGKMVDVTKLKEGDVVRTERGPFVLMWPAGRNRRGGTVLDGAYEKSLKVMLVDPKDTKKMQFYKITPRRTVAYEVVGRVSQTVVQKMRDMSSLLSDVLSMKRAANMEKLNLTWNKSAVVKHRSQGRTRVYSGTYDVTTMKGEKVQAGDKVMVQFSNGKFEMIMGNDNGVVYDGNTGRFLCRSPWKLNVAPRVRLSYSPMHGIVQKVSKPKARSMPPDTLLYLIAKKGTF